MPLRLSKLGASAQENGWFLTLQRAGQALGRRLRDRILARDLRTHGLALGHNPRLYGLRYLHLGANFSAADGLWLEAVTEYGGVRYTPSITIGDNCNLSSYVHIACTNRVTIGSGLLCGSHVIITDHAHGQYRGPAQTGPDLRPAARRLSNDGTVHIGNNVWLGDGVAILAGAEIGDGTVIGANAVVNGPIPPNTMAAGAPARPIRRWNGAEWARIPNPS